MNRYNRMFHAQIFNLHTRSYNDPSFVEGFKLNVPKEDEDIFRSILKKRLNLIDGTEGDDEGNAVFTPVEMMDTYKDKDLLIEDLNSILPALDGRERQIVSNVIAELQAYVQEKQQQAEEVGAPTEEATSLTFPRISQDVDLAAHRFDQLKNFAYNKEKDPSYFPTESPKVNTSKYDGLSRGQIAKNFEAENFYKLGKEEVPALLQAAANEYCRANGIEPCAVVIEDLPLDSKNATFGEYDPGRGVIIINKRVLDKYDSFRDQGNQTFPLHLLSTVIHEAHHRTQFAKFNETDLNPRDEVVVNALREPRLMRSHADYLAAPEEMDSRNAALKYLRECGLENDSSVMLAYYNERAASEKANGKSPVTPEVEALFPDIFASEKQETDVNLTSDILTWGDIVYHGKAESSREQDN